MSLKTFVKVGKITNLSDARYCSGMGVDMLGFRVIHSDPDYITPDRFKEFRGWFTGPTVVAEAYGIRSADEISLIIENYQPDYLEASITDLKNLKTISLPIILSVSVNELHNVKSLASKFNIEYLLLTTLPTNEIVEQLNAEFKILVELKGEKELDNVEVNSTLVTGISLNGTPEERPGLKNYDLLSFVLERLESQD